MIQKMPDPGVRFAALTDVAREQFVIDARVSGVLVAAVEADCESRDLGIVTCDVITAAQSAPVATPDDVRQAVQTAHQNGARFSPYSFRARAALDGCRCRCAAPAHNE
jgi:S1-C subfamily serine protease